MSKRTKTESNASRDLAAIVVEIRKTLSNDTANVIRRGQLLLEAKDQLEHGQWLPWLEENFSMDERTRSALWPSPSSLPNTTICRICA